MRPLPITALPGAPTVVAGVSVVRGAPLPVVVAGRLFENVEQPPGRLVVVRAGARRIGLAFDSVLGVRSAPSKMLSALPPLLDRGSPAVADIATLDEALMLVLDAARIVPEDVFVMLETKVSAS